MKKIKKIICNQVFGVNKHDIYNSWRESELMNKFYATYLLIISFWSFLLLALQQPSPIDHIQLFINISMGILAFNLMVVGSIFVVQVLMVNIPVKKLKAVKDE